MVELILLLDFHKLSTCDMQKIRVHLQFSKPSFQKNF